MDACASVTRRIKSFFANRKPELDSREPGNDSARELGPSEREQARKDKERLDQIQAARESEAGRTFNQLAVLDRSIKERIGRHCGTPMDQLCQNAVSEAESLTAKGDAYNANAGFVSVRGRLVLESPALAAPYAKMHAAHWEEYNKKAHEDRTRRSREAEEKRQKLTDAEKSKKEAGSADAANDIAAVALPRRGSSAGSAMFQQAISKAEQDERDASRRPATASVSAAASQTPTERLTKSYDDRISTAREQCVSGESGCQKACLGVAAVGVLSILSGNRAGGTAAGDQTQQCSNRCDEARSRCDEQVSALEQEKSQALTTAAAPSPPQGSTSYASNPGSGKSRYSSICMRNVEKIDNVMRASPARSYGASNDLFLKDVNFFAAKLVEPCRANDPDSANAHKRAMDEYNRIARVCAGPHDKLQCNQWGFDTNYRGRNQNWYSIWKAEVDKALSDPNYSADLDGGATNLRASTGGFSGDCKAAYDRQEAEFTPVVQRIQITQSAVRQMQLTMGMMGKRLALLDQLCKGQPQYSEYAPMKKQYDITMRNCRGVATNPGECVPH